ncbi:hypothetical protein C0081_20325 [Cohaesibacter celericrescens]|uniref:Uncharacterized protein n=1 Tax=Cohaesibacter celericrescens TaxID=2067669 RepID=A0A2N5XLR6_9HYPH|nr:hypothetical protein C0081_20325 [Cohaesibacter celericrescens]
MFDRRIHIMRQAARDLKAQAAKLEKDAQQIEREQKLRRRLNALYRKSASSVKPAQFAREHNLPIETVKSWQKRQERQTMDAKKIERDRSIMRLARKGWTNSEIGKALGLHANSISRIISKQKRLALFPDRAMPND